MFKRIVCLLVMVSLLTGSAMLAGCGDDIKTEKRVEIRDKPIGEPEFIID